METIQHHISFEKKLGQLNNKKNLAPMMNIKLGLCWMEKFPTWGSRRAIWKIILAVKNSLCCIQKQIVSRCSCLEEDSVSFASFWWSRMRQIIQTSKERSPKSIYPRIHICYKDLYSFLLPSYFNLNSQQDPPSNVILFALTLFNCYRCEKLLA